MNTFKTLAAVCAALAVSSSAFAQVSVDGVIGTEWAGANMVSVGYSAAAPVGNFGAPTDMNETVAYNIYTRSDTNWIYVGLETNEAAGGSADSALLGANLYFDTNPDTAPGSNLGFEVTNDRAFIPGVPGYNTVGLDASNYNYATMNVPGLKVIEFALSWNYLMTDPGSMGFPTVTDAVQLRLSQSFGYAVAGGATYGVDRLGRFEAVPEPCTMVIGALAGVAALRKKFAKKK